MPMFDYICEGCKFHFEKFHHPTSPAPEKAKCEICDIAEGVLTFEPSIAMQRPYTCSDAQAFSPVVIHKDAKGNVRFPGSANAPVPEGFQRVELTNVSQVRKLEREVNAFELSRAEGNRLKQRDKAEGERMERRSKFKELVRNFSPRGRQFAEAMMIARDRHKTRLDKRITDMGFRVDAFSNNHSNREEYRDSATGWKQGRR